MKMLKENDVKDKREKSVVRNQRVFFSDQSVCLLVDRLDSILLSSQTKRLTKLVVTISLLDVQR